MSVLAPTLAIALAFLIGSVPTALLIGKTRGIDIRTIGSRNVGATNLFREVGKGIGFACLVIDAIKGWAPAFIFSGQGPAGPAWRPEAITHPATWMLLVGLAAIAGHSFSPWVGFKGGKGVATSLGVYLAVAPGPILICLAVGMTLIAVTRYVSVASIVGAVLLPTLMIVMPPEAGRSWTVLTLTTILCAFVIWRHRGNISRLARGNENRLFVAKGPSETGAPGDLEGAEGDRDR